MTKRRVKGEGSVYWRSNGRVVGENEDATGKRRYNSGKTKPEVRKKLRKLLADWDDKLEALYVLAVTTGLRQGELLGLQWRDVDLDSGPLRANRSVYKALVLSGGVPVKVVSETLGHGDVATTLSVYLSVLPHRQESAARVMEDVLG